MATVEELVERLKDFRTRSAAKDGLLELGEKAVHPLIGALHSRNANLRWAAVSILGELGSREAVPELIDCLADTQVRAAAVEALEHITGQELGEDEDGWRRWWGMAQGRETLEATSAAGAVTDADLIRQAVYGTDIAANEGPHGYVLRVPLGDRHQDVVVNFHAKDGEGTPLAVAYTVCGLAAAANYEWALRQNVRMSAGAIAIADVSGKPHFVIVDVMLRSMVTPEQLAESVRRVARKGDQLEAALTKADKH